MTLRVVLADDHPIVRHGLADIVAAGGHEVVGQAANGAEAVALVDKLLAAGQKPDLVLLDLRMPVMDGAAATREMAGRDIPVLVLTTYDTDSAILSAIEAGATGFLLKDTPAAGLLEAIESAAARRTTLAPVAAAALMNRMRDGDPEPLTARETEVLRLVGEGLTNSQIAGKLIIAESTVKTHLLRIFTKLGVDDRTRAVTLAMQRGLI